MQDQIQYPYYNRMSTNAEKKLYTLFFVASILFIVISVTLQPLA